MASLSQSSARFGVVVAGQHRRQLVHAARQVGQEAPHLRQRVGLVHGLVVHQRALAVRLVAAQLVLVDLHAVGLAHHVRPGGHDLGLVAHQHREVRRQHLDRALPGAGAQRHAHHRHGVQQRLAGQVVYSGILVPPICISSLTLPPAESTSRTSGMRSWCARRSM
jgi:hypothetical protein